MRVFSSGATRDTDQGKIDYDGILSPAALQIYGEYMTKHSVQADGSVRASDNWQKGIPQAVYRKSLMRHTLEVWKLNRAGADYEAQTEALCGVLFNAMGLLHELSAEQDLRAKLDDLAEALPSLKEQFAMLKPIDGPGPRPPAGYKTINVGGNMSWKS